MFERYTESARRTLFFARYEVSALGATQIEPGHLLLGLLREPEGLVGRILAAAHVSLASIRREVEGIPARETISTSVEIPFASAAQAVLQAAAEEAERLLHSYIGTEHLLLGLLRVEDSPAATILVRYGLRLDAVREQVRNASGQLAARDAPDSHNLSVDRAIDVYTQLLEAWNRRDAESFAALFVETGSAIGYDGSQMHGRAEIETALRGVFASHHTSSYVAKVREVRSLGSGAALLRAVAGMVPPGTQELNAAVNAVQSVVFISEGAELRIALLQNTPAAFHGRPELARQLTEELSAIVRAGRIVDGP